MLSALHRFHGHGSLRYVYKNGQAVRSHLITIKFTANPRRKHSRFAVVVSKKVHKGAVGRNRIRRRVYEVVRQELPELSPERMHDVVLMVFSSEVLALPHDELVAVVRDLFTQADLYKK